MNYRFKKMPEEIDFWFTSFSAIRRDAFVPFEDDIKPKDTIAGQILVKKMGRKIFFDKELEVVHLKKHTFSSIIKNDFSVTFGWATYFWKIGGAEDVIRRGRFAHSTLDQILSVVIAPAMFIAVIAAAARAPFCIILSLSLVLAFLSLNADFFLTLRRKTGTLFIVQAVAFTFLDCLTYAAGVGCGFINSLFQGKARKFDSIKVIAFDLGNVLLLFNPWRAVFNLAKASNRSSLIIAAYFRATGNWNKFDEGAYSKSQFYRLVNNDLRLNISQDAFERAFEDIFLENREIIDMLPELKKRFRLILISDINPIHADYCMRKYRFLELFEEKILSYQVKLRKPSREIFQLLVQKTVTCPT